MNRYVLSIALGAFAIGAIGTYYSFFSLGDTPQYKLITAEGDSQEGNRIRIDGAYVGGVGSKALSVSAAGTDYYYKSFAEKYLQDNRYLMTEYADVRDFKREHRNFMRAKTNVSNFYKDEQWLIYAEIALKHPNDDLENTELKMDLLEEATGKTKQYRIKLDESGPLDWASVEDVQRIGEEVHVLLQFRSDSGSSSVKSSGIVEEFHDLVVDLNTGERLRDLTLSSDRLGEGPSEESDTTVAEGIGTSNVAKAVMRGLRLSTISSEVRSRPSEYVVLRVSKESRSGEGEKERVTQSDQFTAYSYRTGELVPLPELSKSNDSQYVEFRLSGERLSVLHGNGNHLSLSHYRLSTGQEEGKLDLKSDQLGGGSIRQVRLANDRLYTLVQNKNEKNVRKVGSTDISAVIVDAANGNVLYKGEASYTGPSEKADEFRKNLWLTNLYVTNE